MIIKSGNWSIQTLSLNVENAIKLVVKTGKFQIGPKKALNNVKRGIGKLVVVSSNCPKTILDDLEVYCKLANIHIHQFKGSNYDLGFLVGKTYSISVLTVLEPGDSEILKLAEPEPA